MTRSFKPRRSGSTRGRKVVPVISMGPSLAARSTSQVPIGIPSTTLQALLSLYWPKTLRHIYWVLFSLPHLYVSSRSNMESFVCTLPEEKFIMTTIYINWDPYPSRSSFAALSFASWSSSENPVKKPQKTRPVKLDLHQRLEPMFVCWMCCGNEQNPWKGGCCIVELSHKKFMITKKWNMKITNHIKASQHDRHYHRQDTPKYRMTNNQI